MSEQTIKELREMLARERGDLDILIHEEELVKKYNCFARPKGVKTSKGLGDVVESVANSLGIKPCSGCKKRKEWLNRIRIK